MANFKETQLADLRIGQPVDLHVDAYANQVFHGRVSGFAPATGAASSLLPAENATGNFVKVVQRLAVRIDLTEPNPAADAAAGRPFRRARGGLRRPAGRTRRRTAAPQQQTAYPSLRSLEETEP